MNRIIKFTQNRIFFSGEGLKNDSIFWSFVFSVLQLCLLYSGGFILGFIPCDYPDIETSFKVFLSTGSLILINEFLRSAALFIFNRFNFNKYASCLFSSALFTVTDFLLFVHSSYTPDNKYVLIIYSFFSILNSLLLTFLCYKGGAVASFIFAFITKSCTVLVPFEPAVNEKAEIFIKAVLCMIFLITLDCYYSKESKTKKISFVKRRISAFLSAGLVGIICFIVAFVCGFLTVAPVSVATGSMEPQINIGDVVLVSKSETEYSVGDIIQFKRNNKTVIHRIVATEETKSGVSYITKGDANNTNDSGYVKNTDIVGKVIYTVPQIGKLTLWLHSD